MSFHFQVSSKSGKTFSIFLSSEYERSQWVEALKILQEKLPPNTSQVNLKSYKINGSVVDSLNQGILKQGRNNFHYMISESKNLV